MDLTSLRAGEPSREEQRSTYTEGDTLEAMLQACGCCLSQHLEG